LSKCTRLSPDHAGTSVLPQRAPRAVPSLDASPPPYTRHCYPMRTWIGESRMKSRRLRDRGRVLDDPLGRRRLGMATSPRFSRVGPPGSRSVCDPKSGSSTRASIAEHWGVWPNACRTAVRLRRTSVIACDRDLYYLFVYGAGPTPGHRRASALFHRDGGPGQLLRFRYVGHVRAFVTPRRPIRIDCATSLADR